MTESEGQTLEHVLPLLGMAYHDWKRWEKAKDEYKAQFFELANQALTRKGLAYKTVTILLTDEGRARARAALHNPGWTVISTKSSDVPDSWDVLLQEDPTLKAFVSVHNGVRYARSVSKGTVMVDDDWLAEDEPELYDAVTFQLPWGDRMMIPVEQLSKAILPRLEKYIYLARPRVALTAPRPLKDDEA